MNKRYRLKTQDKNILTALMRLGGEYKAIDLHPAVPELNWEMFGKYLRQLSNVSQAFTINKKGRVDVDSIVKADLEVEIKLRP